MPIKRSNSGKLSRKSSSNGIQASELEQKNSLLNMFKKIESDSKLVECNLCNKKFKLSLINKHKQFECLDNIKKESFNGHEVIILDDNDDKFIPESKECNKVEHDDFDENNWSTKRIKLDQNSIFSEKSAESDSFEIEDKVLPDNEQFDFYLSNFSNAIDSVLNEEQFKHLFDEKDQRAFEIFNLLSNSAKILYVRLFQRKFKWHSLENINYEKLGKDLSPFLDELKKNTFLIDDTSIETYEEIICLFKIPQLKELIRLCHISVVQTNKTEMIRAILQHFRTQKGVKSHFFKKQPNDQATCEATPNYMLQCKKILGKCFKLDKNIRSIFVRTLILYSLSSSYQSDPSNAGQQQL